MAHYKPKAASPIYSEARLILLTDPNLKYKEVFDKMTTPCSRGSIDAYGASIRHEIGCELRTVDGHERLEVNYVKYLAACKLYAVRPLTVKSLLKTRTKSRDVVVDEQLPPPPEEIPLSDEFDPREAFPPVMPEGAAYDDLPMSVGAPESLLDDGRLADDERDALYSELRESPLEPTRPMFAGAPPEPAEEPPLALPVAKHRPLVLPALALCRAAGEHHQ
jgi:hypothetical protein